MRRLSIKNALGLSLMLMLLTACVASPPTRLDAKFGEAIEMAIAQQIMYPDASLNTEAVMGIDGLAADAGFDNYRKSFMIRQTQETGGVRFGSGSSTSGGQ